MRLRFQVVLFFIAMLVCAPFAQGGEQDSAGEMADAVSEEPFELTADELEFERARDLYIARGNVVIRQMERTLRADWIAFSQTTGIGVASGNVELVDGGDVVRADFVEFNINNLQGVVRHGSFDSDASQFRGSGVEITKGEGQRYAFKEAEFTTCRCPDDEARVPWRIRAEEVDVEVAGYGTARNTTVDVLGVPLVWFPWMIYPIKSERQSGVLLPEVSLASRNGFGVGLPIFWAARDEVNVTLTPGWMSKRGFKGDVEFEYVYGEESSGELFGSYARDQDIDPDSLETPFGRDRWSALGTQDMHAPGGLRFKGDFRFTSDNEYPLDFEELRSRRADRYLESTGFGGRDFGRSGRYGAVISALYADDMQNPDDIDRDDYVLQRLPQVEGSVLPGAFAGIPLIQPSLDLDYTYFYPIGSAIDERPTAIVQPGFLDTGVDSVPDAQELPPGSDPHDDNFDLVTGEGTEDDGIFQEGEPLTDQGQRFLLHPRIGVPLQIGSVLESYSEVGWHQTLYQSRERDFEERGFLTARVDLRSRLRRRLGKHTTHILEPAIGYALVTAKSQDDNPLFVPETALPQQRMRSLDLDNVTRDPADRIERANRATFGVTNRFHGRPPEGGPARLLADFTLLGLYEFEKQEFGDVILDGRAYPFPKTDARYNLAFNPEKEQIDEALAEVSWAHKQGHRIQLGYRYLRDVPDVFERFAFGDRWDNFKPIDQINQVNGLLRLSVLSRWTLGYRLAYSFDQDLMIGNEGMIEYLSRCGCWAAGVQLGQDRAGGVQIRFLYRIVGLGQDIGSGGNRFLDGF